MASQIPSLNVPARTFTLFSQLPMELQDMIWAMAQENQEQIIVQIASVIANPRVYTISTSGIPLMLYACHRSREIALHYNSLHFGAIRGRPLYFNADRDLLQLVGFKGWALTTNLTLADISMARNVMMLEHPLTLRNENSYIFTLPTQLMPFHTMQSFYYQELEPWQMAQMIAHERQNWRHRVTSAVLNFWHDIINRIQAKQGRQLTEAPRVFFCDAQGVIQPFH